ncbi:MAG: hypothetical protein RIR62_2685 [Pseudomonadota bacterium]
MFLSNPKTATQSLRAMLRPLSLRVAPFGEQHSKHMGIMPFEKNWRLKVEQHLKAPVETVAVVREPFARLESWFRYRKRNPLGAENSTLGIGFEEFARLAISADPPVFAKVGDQGHFLGWDRAHGEAVVTHVFDYDRMDLLLDFLGQRLGMGFVLPRQNVSMTRDEVRVDPLSEATMAAYRRAMEAEFAVYEAVRARGYLSR